MISKILAGGKTSEVVENADESSFGEGQVLAKDNRQIAGTVRGDIQMQVRIVSNLFGIAA